MNIEEYTGKIKNIQSTLLTFLENENNCKENFSNLQQLINDQQICTNKGDLILFLHLISKISINHRNNCSFNNKIDEILKYYLPDIKKNCLNSEIFNIFKGNKRILLFLLEEKVISLDQYIISKIFVDKYINANYIQYFLPEVKPFLNKLNFPRIEDYSQIINRLPEDLPENFNELRKKGQNERPICDIIRRDSLDEFIVYINKNDCSLESEINSSIYETNSFINKYQNKLTMIQYAAFFGSIEIFKYLQRNKVTISISELMDFAIHGNNAEIIYILEENEKIDSKKYEKYLDESIKCHHIDISNYFLENHFTNDKKNSKAFFIKCLKSYNFSFIQNQLIDENTFHNFVQYDYYSLTKILLDVKNIDINKISIENIQI